MVSKIRVTTSEDFDKNRQSSVPSFRKMYGDALDNVGIKQQPVVDELKEIKKLQREAAAQAKADDRNVHRVVKDNKIAQEILDNNNLDKKYQKTKTKQEKVVKTSLSPEQKEINKEVEKNKYEFWKENLFCLPLYPTDLMYLHLSILKKIDLLLSSIKI